MKILVVGPGAIGLLHAVMLTRGRHEVLLLGRRQEAVDAINRDGVTVERVSTGTTSNVPVRATLNASEAGAVDLVLVCVKCYSTLQATKDALPAFGPGTAVLTLQNGLGNVEAISSVVGRERVLAGITGVGVTLLGPGSVRHAGEGHTMMGELDGRLTDRLESVAEALRQSGIEVDLSTEVDSLLWGKVVINAALNPLAALLRVRNGDLVERPDARTLMGAVARETASVAEAKGIRLPYPDPIARVEEVCRATRTNKVSMLQDVERGAETEVDYINGAVVREGEAAGVPTPINWALTRLVKALQPHPV